MNIRDEVRSKVEGDSGVAFVTKTDNQRGYVLNLLIHSSGARGKCPSIQTNNLRFPSDPHMGDIARSCGTSLARLGYGGWAMRWRAGRS